MKQEKKPKKYGLTLFILIIPSLLLAMTSAVTDLWIRIFFQVVLLLLQMVMIKNMLDDYYNSYD